MARKKSKGTPLKVFSGKEATLNRVILRILEKKSPLIAYDIWRKLKMIKGLRNTDANTVYRRVKSLEQQGWVVQKGRRQTQPGWDSALYELTLKGKVAIRLDEKSIEEFLSNATDEELLQLLKIMT